MVFPVFSEAPRMVHRDPEMEAFALIIPCHLNTSDARCGRGGESRLVRIFNTRMEQIALHALEQQGRFSTDPVYAPLIPANGRPSKKSRTGCWIVPGSSAPQSGTWAELMIKKPGTAR